VHTIGVIESMFGNDLGMQYTTSNRALISKEKKKKRTGLWILQPRCEKSHQMLGVFPSWNDQICLNLLFTLINFFFFGLGWICVIFLHIQSNRIINMLGHIRLIRSLFKN